MTKGIDVTQDGSDIDCVCCVFRDGYVMLMGCTPEIVAAVALRTCGNVQVDTCLRPGPTYEHGKIVWMIRHPGIRLERGIARVLTVKSWVMYPVDVIDQSGEIVTVDRLVIESSGSERHYTDDMYTINAWLVQLYDWADDEEQWPVVRYPA